MSFDYLVGYIMSISMCMQNFIIIFHSVQEIWPFSLFQSLELGKASTDEKCNLATSWARSCYAKVYQNIPVSLRDRPFSPFQNLALGKASTDDKCHFKFLELDHVNVNVSAKFYQNIPNGLRVKFHCFQNLNLGKTSTNPKCHLTISCNSNVYAKFHHNIPLSSRDRAIFTFSEFKARQSLDR